GGGGPPPREQSRTLTPPPFRRGARLADTPPGTPVKPVTARARGGPARCGRDRRVAGRTPSRLTEAMPDGASPHPDQAWSNAVRTNRTHEVTFAGSSALARSLNEPSVYRPQGVDLRVSAGEAGDRRPSGRCPGAGRPDRRRVQGGMPGLGGASLVADTGARWTGLRGGLTAPDRRT